MGPLNGVRVVEIAGIGPGPFCAMMLADLGADVIRVERTGGGSTNLPVDLLNRGRRSLGVNLKRAEGAELVLKLVETADVVLEGFRPGVAERLGIGPDACLARNPKVVYGRITGWGQDGPLAARAGHDLNYIGIAGALDPIGHAGGPPVIPLNLVADFGGGGMLLAFGVVSALVETQRSGKGQVVDAAMVDGASLLTTMFHGLLASGMWQTARGSNMLDGGAPFYQVYETKDGEHMAAGGIEPKFYVEMLRGLGLEGADLPFQYDQGRWPEMRARFAEIFRTKTRAEWTEIFEDRDACVTPVLSLTEARDHRHNLARGTFVEVDGVPQPAPAPRFSRTPNAVPGPPAKAGQHTDEILAELGLDADEISALRSARTVG
jgi:alpha-methylacyl-CoA racemase